MILNIQAWQAGWSPLGAQVPYLPSGIARLARNWLHFLGLSSWAGPKGGLQAGWIPFSSGWQGPMSTGTPCSSSPQMGPKHMGLLKQTRHGFLTVGMVITYGLDQTGWTWSADSHSLVVLCLRGSSSATQFNNKPSYSFWGFENLLKSPGTSRTRVSLGCRRADHATRAKQPNPLELVDPSRQTHRLKD